MKRLTPVNDSLAPVYKPIQQKVVYTDISKIKFDPPSTIIGKYNLNVIVK